MKGIKTLPVFMVFIILLLSLILSGCSNVRGFADPVAENVLVSINEKNYESFSKDFDDNLKKSLTKEQFADTTLFNVDVVGTYKENSKKLVKFENVKGEYSDTDYTAVYYNVDFSVLKDQTLEIIFSKIGEDMKVSLLMIK
jgi:major membrane immunogen (membrane-anchored lipoprotein)